MSIGDDSMDTPSVDIDDVEVSKIGATLDDTSPAIKKIVGRDIIMRDIVDDNGDPLPDVDGKITMTMRLTANTGRYEDAAKAFARVIKGIIP